MGGANETWITCPARPANGGLGQNLVQQVHEARARGEVVRCIAPGMAPDEGLAVDPVPVVSLARATPLRFSRRWLTTTGNVAFDLGAAARLRPGARLLAYNGAALFTIRRARRLGYRQIDLMSATLHVDQIWEAQERARLDSGGDRGWLGPLERRRTLQEYAEADRILVCSPLALETFATRGVPREKLALVDLRPDPRFSRARVAPRADGVFRAVYTGDISALKGAHVLRLAFGRLRDVEARLTLVGGTGSRFMRRFMEAWLREDDRVTVQPGDPLPHLLQADVYVHPSYSDGFPLASTEALACGVPVILSADSGTRHLVQEGRTGFVVPTGDAAALHDRLRRIAAGQLLPASTRA